MNSPAEALQRIHERIDASACKAGRTSQDIILVAATKTVPLDQILPWLQAGVRHVGENRVQEGLIKYSTPSPLGRGEGPGEGSPRPTFHLIGPLQTNKAKKAVGFFDMIQSLDRWDLALDINRHAQALGKKQACLVEVKISPEASKTGLPPEQLEEFLEQVKKLPGLEVKGLMGIPPITPTPEESRPYFARLRRFLEKTGLTILSMGMSADFEIAIEEGSTMVRLGTALFGGRN